MEDGRCAGVWTKDRQGKAFLRKADFVVLAAGGCGNLFQINTNNRSVTSDAISLAYRAGAFSEKRLPTAVFRPDATAASVFNP